MRPRVLPALVLTALGLSGGCGTVANLVVGTRSTIIDLHTRPFGGIYVDFLVCAQSIFLVPLGLVDFPLSLAGDVLTLPWTILVDSARQQDLEWRRARDPEMPPPYVPPRVDARVTAVRRDVSPAVVFVAAGAGRVRKGQWLGIYRGEVYVATVEVQEVGPDSCACREAEDAPRTDRRIERDDAVRFR